MVVIETFVEDVSNPFGHLIKRNINLVYPSYCFLGGGGRDGVMGFLKLSIFGSNDTF